MTDTPGREPGGTSPSPDAPARDAAAGRARAGRALHVAAVDPRTFELTPERAAQVVRQSSNARWVGFLATSSS